MIEDEFSRPAKRTPDERPFETLSIEELEVKITELKAEIARCEEAIRSKKGHRDAADAIFGRRPNDAA